MEHSQLVSRQAVVAVGAGTRAERELHLTRASTAVGGLRCRVGHGECPFIAAAADAAPIVLAPDGFQVIDALWKAFCHIHLQRISFAPHWGEEAVVTIEQQCHHLGAAEVFTNLTHATVNLPADSHLVS